jgi:hypothetical protein
MTEPINIYQTTDEQLQLAADFVRFTGLNIFLTGKAGTGKTTFLRNLKNITYKRFVVVAPTGVAAINAGGVTIHSFFQLPFGPQLPEGIASQPQDEGDRAKASAARYQRFTREKINIIKSLDLLVIDEISMVRADLLDAIDAVLKRYRDRNKPFGGVQLLMIGDLQQLAPIAKEDEWDLLRKYYDSVYFFSSKALQQTNYISIELQHVYRQSDETFIRLLNKVRSNELDEEAIILLNARHIAGFSPKEDEGYITLTTHNAQAHTINQQKLDHIKGKLYNYDAEIKGEFPSHAYPTDEKLSLKVGAQVMFIKNDPSGAKAFFNGKIGKLVDVEDETMYVQCPGDDDAISVKPLEWQNCRYSLDDQTNEITETVIGSFTQYPLKLAWAVTIHKSQGLTFEKAIIDARAAFAHGQVYVALSRCKTYEGMVLSSQIPPSAIKTDFTVGRYVENIAQNQPDQIALKRARENYQASLLHELFDFRPLLWRISSIRKQLAEHATILPQNHQSLVAEKENMLKQDIIAIADKFVAQLNHLLATNPDAETNEKLQERLMAACGYFAPLVDKFIFNDLRVPETDNRAVQKNLDDAYGRLLAEGRIKMECLNASKQGFRLDKHLETKAKAAIEKTVLPKPPPRESAHGAKVEHPILMARLKVWRKHTADEMDVPEHMIFPLMALRGIADVLPVSRKELLAIKGIGKRRQQQFGDEVLDIIKTYINDHHIKAEVDTSLLREEKKPKKEDSKLISLELFKAGNSIAEVAEKRGFAVTTIEGHLSWYVARGELDISGMVANDKVKLITEYFTEVDDYRLGAAKEVLGDDISYGELRLVFSHLKHNGLVNEK